MNGALVCDLADFAKLYDSPSLMKCDANGDGVIDIEDVNTVVNKILGK